MLARVTTQHSIEHTLIQVQINLHIDLGANDLIQMEYAVPMSLTLIVIYVICWQNEFLT